MALALGIHLGHHASCALVHDGVLVAGLAQERITRVKHDGQEALSNRLPIRECLAAAGAGLQDVDVIVSSFQAASPAGVGLHRPLVEDGFNLFDPADSRHSVVSHHYAHALSALCLSGFDDAAVLICDLGGSTTTDGQDFFLPFVQYADMLNSVSGPYNPLTERLSVYRGGAASLTLINREYWSPHSTPDVFVQSAASLYDNVSRMIFGRDNAHGEMMALASMCRGAPDIGLTVDDLVTIEQGKPRFHNGWQSRIRRHDRILENAGLAQIVQAAFQKSLLAHAAEARRLSGCDNLAVAGGVFLNILANTAISQSGLFRGYYAPSAPHDEGVSIGCAFHGTRMLAKRTAARVTADKLRDRVGPMATAFQIDDAITRNRARLAPVQDPDADEIARHLSIGAVIARCAGPSEFGPRALGGRSLLASPLLPGTKERLNRIKGRQDWRPVAPLILRERCNIYFEGPDDSPYMNFVHTIRPRYRDTLIALEHPDCSTRAQTLERDSDPQLYKIVESFERLTGYPILVNTSLNGPGEPIVQSIDDAIEFFLRHTEVDLLLLEGRLLARMAQPDLSVIRLARDTVMSSIYPGGRKRTFLLRRGQSIEISDPTISHIDEAPSREAGPSMNGAIAPEVRDELAEALRRGFLDSG